MSLATDVKSYADAAVEAAVEQGKQALDAAQAGLDKLLSTANAMTSNAKDATPLTVESLRSAMEPYLGMAKTYGTAFANKADAVVEELKNDKRFAQAMDASQSLAVAVVGAMREQYEQLMKLSTAAASKAPFTKPAATKPAATKPAATKPAATKPATEATATKAATAKATATKPAATKASPTKPATAKATATKPAAVKAPAPKPADSE